MPVTIDDEEPTGAIVLVFPPVAEIVLASHFQTVFSGTLPTPALPQQTPLDNLADSELIDRAKTAKFPAARKWGRARKLGSGERKRATAYLKCLAAV